MILKCDLASCTPCCHFLRRCHTAHVHDSPPPSFFVLCLEVNVAVKSCPACSTSSWWLECYLCPLDMIFQSSTIIWKKRLITNYRLFRVYLYMTITVNTSCKCLWLVQIPIKWWYFTINTTHNFCIQKRKCKHSDLSLQMSVILVWNDLLKM